MLFSKYFVGCGSESSGGSCHDSDGALGDGSCGYNIKGACGAHGVSDAQ